MPNTVAERVGDHLPTREVVDRYAASVVHAFDRVRGDSRVALDCRGDCGAAADQMLPRDSRVRRGSGRAARRPRRRQGCTAGRRCPGSCRCSSFCCLLLAEGAGRLVSHFGLGHEFAAASDPDYWLTGATAKGAPIRSPIAGIGRGRARRSQGFRVTGVTRVTGERDRCDGCDRYEVVTGAIRIELAIVDHPAHRLTHGVVVEAELVGQLLRRQRLGLAYSTENSPSGVSQVVVRRWSVEQAPDP